MQTIRFRGSIPNGAAPRRARRTALLLGLALIAALGGRAELVAPAAAQPAEAAVVGPADIDPIDEALFGEVIAANRGNVVLVNLWATWCAPCLKEIPELVELERDLGPRGLRLIGVSLDDVGSQDKIREFRDRWFPEFRTFYVTDEDWYGLVGQIDPRWSSILPTTFVLDRNGTLVDTVTGGRDYAAFEAAVAPHL